MELLQEKINKLKNDSWFKILTYPPISIHDVIEQDEGTYVIWSDKSGYSVSYKTCNGKVRGVSGIYDTLFKCFEYIPGHFIKTFITQIL